jgi:hypothetical protein
MPRAAVGPLLLACIALVIASPPPARGQVLDQLRHDVREGTGDSSSNPSSNNSSTNDTKRREPAEASCPDSGIETEPSRDACEFILRVLMAPYWIPASMSGDDYEKAGYFLRYPYRDERPGSMYITPPDGLRHRDWQAELAFEYADNFDDLARYGGHLRLSTTSRVDVETNWNTLAEETPRGNDHVTIGDVDLLFRFAQSERLQMRSGIGANWFDDHQGAVAGFNFRYGADYFPCRPWHLAALCDLGELGKAGLVHVRSTAGITYARWELFTGYDYRKIGSVHFGGPLAGVQFRF